MSFGLLHVFRSHVEVVRKELVEVRGAVLAQGLPQVVAMLVPEPHHPLVKHLLEDVCSCLLYTSDAADE